VLIQHSMSKSMPMFLHSHGISKKL